HEQTHPSQRKSTNTREHLTSAATESKTTSPAPEANFPHVSAFLLATHTASNTTQSAPLFENIFKYIFDARNRAPDWALIEKCGRAPSYQYEGSYQGGYEPCTGEINS